MKYQNNLLKMSVHPMHYKLFQKLSNEEMAVVTAFVKNTENLDNDQYIFMCNRWYLDQPKPKHYADMWAIISQVRNV